VAQGVKEEPAMPKPRDFFIGVTEFFAVLVPGALLFHRYPEIGKLQD
jgi:hypothetical protein